jgi:NAD(P)-dependent dehydrogenase (short-subunit alcohol dehydrogenase family)
MRDDRSKRTENEMSSDSATQSLKGRAFAGRRALVTGASRGIAAELARALAHAGADVAVNFSAGADAWAGKADAAEHLVAEIVAAGGRASAIEQDLMQPGAGRRLAEQAARRIGQIDTVILSASIQHHIPFLLQSDTEIADQLRINVLTNIELLQTLLPPMARAGYGRILSIGSIQEVAPAAEMPIYSLTKAAIRNLIENLALQCAGQGIMVNNIAPGLIETDRNAFRRVDPDTWARTQANANPVGRAGQPADLTALALHLLSPANTFTTGATILSTGGSHIPGARGADGPRLVLPDLDAAQ